MRFLKDLFKRLRFKLGNPSVPVNLYRLGTGTIMEPYGINIAFHTTREERIYVEVGDKCIINGQFIFETDTGRVKIGNNVHMGGTMFICKSAITIGNDVTMAWDIVLYDHDSHSINWESRSNDNNQCYNDFLNEGGNKIINKDWTNVNTRPIAIQDKVWIGFGVTVLKGVTIGEGAVVGAKSVVTRDVPPWTVVAGNPAKVVKYIKEQR